MTILQCTEGRANNKVSLWSADGYTIAAECKFGHNLHIYNCKFAKYLPHDKLGRLLHHLQTTLTKIQNLINYQIQHTLDLSKLQLKLQKKHDNQHGKQSNYPYFKLAPWNGVNIFNKRNNNTKHSFQHLLISVKRINQTISIFQKCFESTLYLVAKNVIGNKR